MLMRQKLLLNQLQFVTYCYRMLIFHMFLPLTIKLLYVRVVYMNVTSPCQVFEAVSAEKSTDLCVMYVSFSLEMEHILFKGYE